ncbi:hypothetical protein MKX03_017722 [Papaver bracteatum]|nr:hypothetical protein MKX03_017722 [Papaver bracteatum]
MELVSGLINLDDWSDEEVESIIKIGGNSSANSTHNACIPDGITKPGADSSLERSSKFVRPKLLTHQLH